MSRTVKILELGNEFEAKLLSEILTEKNIPHIVRTYHDSAYDGLWATPSNWGMLEAPVEFTEEIKQIFNQMSH